MLPNDEKYPLAQVTAATVTTAAFAKTFLPFYLIGSTGVFVLTSAIGVTLLAIAWRPLCDMGSKVVDVLLLLGPLYVLVVINFVVYSRSTVPITYLAGILIFHALFMIFGFAAARSLKAVMVMLLAAAAFYVIVIVNYTVRFGDLMQGGYINDILGVGDLAVFIAFHQKIGITLALAALAAVGLSSSRITRILALGALPLVLLFLFHIAARTALVALVCSLIFLAGAGLWVRSKRLASLGFVAVIVVATFASGIFYERALQEKDIGAAPDAMSRTIREIQNPDPGFRLQIWSEAWHRIATEPDRLLFGRGIGMYPVNEGFGAPDWLLRKTAASGHYPHNVHLEMLYEAGIPGLLLFSILTLFPLVISLARWQLFSLAQKSAVSMYVFQIVSSEFSGSFAFNNLDQFFFALTVGIIALNRTADAAVSNAPLPDGALDRRYPARAC
jgi:O-antigen ligase